MDGQLATAVVYLAAAAIAAPVAKRVGLGAVLGYLIAGLIIGPSLLNLVGETEDVRHVAEFGVVMLLFLIGLEVRPALLWSLRTAIFGAGLGQLAATTGALMGVGLLAGLDWRMALATGLILSMSSTAIVLQLLEEQGLRRAPPGRAAFGVLLFQDLAVIPLLAFLPLLATPGVAPAAATEAEPSTNLLSGLPVGLQALGTIAAVLAVVVAGRYLTRPAFRFIARMQLRETFTASALLLVVGVALLMQSVGLSPALGAFLAGVVLAESEFRRELETDIEPFRGLLLGLFFITVGAGLNVPLVLQQPLLLAGMTLGLMLLKGLVMAGVGRLFGERWRDAGTAGAALSQGGEFAFVLLAFVVSAQVLDAQLASLLTAAVALSMAATPIVFALWRRLSREGIERPETPENDFEGADPQVLIAGVGRFGQIVQRVLQANGFETSVLESSVEQIALLRRFGRRVYYGDALRLDLLRAAGAEKARVLVIAIDDAARATELVEMAREAFPHLTVLARAFDRRHAYDLLNHGAHGVERETFEGGLALAADTLRALGWRAYRAERAARLFRMHDEKLFQELRPLWGDEERFTVASRESSPRMDDLLRADVARMGEEDDDLLDPEDAEPAT
ncbi:MAG: monovalent cation:proton antiporter-2 (CPA2) family protein [Caulobacteraceae bacterium]|nr:monovalent cation:proton antiporter-2 (CPA2) family protein [Caulobacteraceae bacterium]